MQIQCVFHCNFKYNGADYVSNKVPEGNHEDFQDFTSNDHAKWKALDVNKRGMDCFKNGHHLLLKLFFEIHVFSENERQKQAEILHWLILQT